MQALEKNGYIIEKNGALYQKIYLNSTKEMSLHNLWYDIPKNNSPGKYASRYPTEKPYKLLERIIKLASNQDSIILDPFCGSGIACIVAEKLYRQWIGMDSNDYAFDNIKAKLGKTNIKKVLV